MDSHRLLEVIRCFSDRPDDVIYDKSQVAFELQNSTYTITVESGPDGLVVNDGQRRRSARRWVVESLAQLNILAQRIVDALEVPNAFVCPAGQLERNYSSEDAQATGVLPDAVAAIRRWCGQHYAFASRVLYVTSDAGEGKTTCINALAAQQAQRFLNGTDLWLLLPVSLGGRPFLRLDEVIVASLLQTYRFQRLYFDALLQLIREDAIILALDGFEEMFVQGQAGDAVSALGNLLSLLGSRGTVIIAARRAYFEYKSLDTQAKLFDSVRSVDVEFARMHLQRWDRARFLEFAQRSGVQDAARLYSGWLGRVRSPDHPLLCRPVLVKHVVKLGDAGAAGSDNLIGETDAIEYYEPFVREILQREAQEKWIDRSTDPAGQILSVEEHLDLLGCVAEEMWLAETESVGVDMLEFAAEAFCEATHKSPHVTRLVVERLKQHALVVSSGGRKFRFDHEEFFQFFLGWTVAKACSELRETLMVKLLGDRPLPLMALQVAASRIDRSQLSVDSIELLCSLCAQEQAYSSIRENCGNLAVLVAENVHDRALTIARAAITQGLLCGRRFSGVTFERCFFGPMELSHTSFSDCRFRECVFQQLVIGVDLHVKDTVIEASDVDSVVLNSNSDGEESVTAYAPMETGVLLQRAGFVVIRGDAVSSDSDVVQTPVFANDHRMRAFQRFLRTFSRATGVNENVLRQRLGTDGATFFDEMLPQLEHVGVVRELEYRGSGTQRRFGLGVPMSQIQSAMEASQGGFDRFLAVFRR